MRAWLSDEIGPGFRLDAPMREFFAHTDGTQDQLLTDWNEYRSRPIDERGRI